MAREALGRLANAPKMKPDEGAFIDSLLSG